MYLVSDQPSKHNKQEDKEKKRKTSVKRNDSSPIFNEVFRVSIYKFKIQIVNQSY